MAYHRVEDGPWPVGTTVAAWPSSQVSGGVPSGGPTASAVASANGVAEFGDLTEGEEYVAFGHGGTQTFTAENEEAAHVNTRKWFPVPTGADDAPDLISRLAAGEKDIALRRGAYAWNQSLGMIPQGAAIVAAGKALTTVTKGFSGDLATLGEGVQLADMTIDGQGATRTGKGFTLSGSNGRQSLRQVVMTGMDDYCLDFATGAGSQSEFFGCKFARYNGISRDVYSVRIDPAQQLAAVPRKFVACETDGTPFIDLGGCNDVFLGPGGYLGKLKFNAESRGVVAAGVRFGGDYSSESPASTGDTTTGSNVISNVTPTTGWANGMTISGPGIPAGARIYSGAGTSTLTLVDINGNAVTATATATGVALTTTVVYIRGFNHSLMGDWGPQPVIAAGSHSSITISGTYNNSPVLDLSSFAYRNIIQSPRAPYSPSFTSGGTQPALGNGTLTGFWSRQGTIVYFQAELIVGSTTTFGTGDIRIGVPLAALGNQTVVAYGFSTNNYVLAGVIPGGQAYASLRIDGAGSVSATTPVAWAAGNVIRVSGSYEL